MVRFLQDNMAARIRTARSEAARMPEFDYGEACSIRPHFGSCFAGILLGKVSHLTHWCCLRAAVVVNQDGRLEDTVREIEAILLAEKRRVPRRCGVP